MKLSDNTQDVATQALILAMKIKQADDLRVMLSSCICIIDERPMLTSQQYLDALTEMAINKGYLDE